MPRDARLVSGKEESCGSAKVGMGNNNNVLNGKINIMSQPDNRGARSSCKSGSIYGISVLSRTVLMRTLENTNDGPLRNTEPVKIAMENTSAPGVHWNQVKTIV